MLFSINTCKYIDATYFSCAVDSIIDMCHYTCLPKIAKEIRDLVSVSNDHYSDVGPFLSILSKCYEQRMQCENNFQVSNCKESVWDFLVESDAEHFAPKGRLDASIHEVPALFSTGNYGKRQFSITRTSRCSNCNQVKMENLPV